MGNHAIDELTIRVVTLNGPQGQQLPALEINITASPADLVKKHLPTLVLPMYRAQELLELLGAAVADMQSMVHQGSDQVQ